MALAKYMGDTTHADSISRIFDWDLADGHAQVFVYTRNVSGA